MELFSLRNTLAHGRTLDIDVSYDTDKEPEQSIPWRIHEWEKLTVDKLDQYRSSIRSAIEIINRARPEPDDEFELWNQGVTGRRVRTLE
jgi:hypothetical protein